ncbi:MAG: hypothetical protein KF716_33760 [Anaerolineae bacterium]|nr:hypothetical protein [Anaerolineae bacterium]
MKQWYSLLTLVFLAVIVAGCTGAAPTADPNGPLLTGNDALPKQLATVYLTPTSDLPDLQATQIRATIESVLPTATLAPATNTPTTTPYVGVFLGAATFEPGDVINQKPSGVRAPRLVGTAQNANIPIFVPTAVAGVPLPTAAGGAVSVGACATAPAAQFANAAQNATVRQQVGCPTNGAFTVNLVQQPFQKGLMIWRDTKQIYVLSSVAIQQGAAMDTLWIVPDQWNDSIPASDGSYIPPDGLIQPVRGFGYVWRSNQQIRDTIGWALAGEQPYQGIWQDFERGWLMTGADGNVYVLIPGNPTGLHLGPLQ